MNKNTLKEQMKSIRSLNLSKRIGAVCECPVCGKLFVKKHIKHVYCGGRDDQVCKNAYNNFIRYNTVYDFGRFVDLKKKNNNSVNKSSNKVSKSFNKYMSFSFGNDSSLSDKELNETKERHKHVSETLGKIEDVLDEDSKNVMNIESSVETRIRAKLEKEFESKYKNKLQEEYNKGYNKACDNYEEAKRLENAEFNGCV